MQVQTNLLPAQTTFCSCTDLPVHPNKAGKFKFSGKEGVDCFTGYDKGSRDFSPNYNQTRSLKQLWSNSNLSLI